MDFLVKGKVDVSYRVNMDFPCRGKMDFSCERKDVTSRLYYISTCTQHIDVRVFP